MFRTFRSLFGPVAMRQGPVSRPAEGDDPLSHPVVRRMTPDQLADLPLGRVANPRKSAGVCARDERLCA